MTSCADALLQLASRMLCVQAASRISINDSSIRSARGTATDSTHDFCCAVAMSASGCGLQVCSSVSGDRRSSLHEKALTREHGLGVLPEPVLAHWFPVMKL